MPDTRLLELLRQYQRRFRLAALCVAMIVAAAAAGLVAAGGLYGVIDARSAQIGAAVAFLAAAGLLSVYVSRRWTLERVARAIESRAALDNLVITAEEVADGRATIRHSAIREEVFAGAIARLEHVDPPAVQPLWRGTTAAGLAILALGALLIALPDQTARVIAASDVTDGVSSAPMQPGDIRVVITPPGYTQQAPVDSVNPARVSALEGSTVRLEMRSPAPGMRTILHELDGTGREFSSEQGFAVLEFAATSSRPLLVRQMRDDGAAHDRLVHLRVDPDERAVVSIRLPGKDLIFPTGRGQVPVEIEARDDVAMQALSLRYTRVSGSGETFTFEEGEWPVEITREGAATWRARAVLSLDALNLQDGDSIVYRATARDAKPGADPSSSQSYLIEVGGMAGVASQGFAVPEERDRHAISQQMVIVKTEKLQAARGSMTDAAFVEQAQLLAVEQRMVQAEFVFMTGGHVHDEIEEAQQSHEIAEGRLENSATTEMLNAIREMSRAEARLNAGDVSGALPFERAALKALQRAFDRRRYFLRTLPERARIDPSRRLTGELDTARSSSVDAATTNVDPLLEKTRDLLHELSTPDIARGDLAVLASRLLALEDASERLQDAALQLTAARDDVERARAVQQAQRALLESMRARPPRPLAGPLERNPVKGRLSEDVPPGTSR